MMMLINLVCHVLHIAATCTSLGGLFYSRVVLLPNLSAVPAEAREAYLAKMIRRYAYVKWIGVVVVVLTGIWQWFQTYPEVANQRAYLLAFAVKMVGAVCLFTVTFLLALPDDRLAAMRRSRAFWSGLNIASAVVLLTGAALMRAVRLGEL